MIWIIYFTIALLTFMLLAKDSLTVNSFGSLIFCLFVSSIWPLFWTVEILFLIWVIFRYIVK